MKCFNFLCYRHKICATTKRDWLKKFIRNCEARKSYNRIIKVELIRTGMILELERDKYHGRK